MKNKLEKGDDMKRLLKSLLASVCAISFVLVMGGIASADLITWKFESLEDSILIEGDAGFTNDKLSITGYFTYKTNASGILGNSGDPNSFSPWCDTIIC